MLSSWLRNHCMEPSTIIYNKYAQWLRYILGVKTSGRTRKKSWNEKLMFERQHGNNITKQSVAEMPDSTFKVNLLQTTRVAWLLLPAAAQLWHYAERARRWVPNNRCVRSFVRPQNDRLTGRKPVNAFVQRSLYYVTHYTDLVFLAANWRTDCGLLTVRPSQQPIQCLYVERMAVDSTAIHATLVFFVVASRTRAGIAQ